MSAPVPGAQLELGLRIPALGGVDEPRLLGFIDVLRQPRADGDQRQQRDRNESQRTDEPFHRVPPSMAVARARDRQDTHWRPAGTKPKSDGPARESHDTEHL